MSMNYNKNKTSVALNPGLSHWKLQRLSALILIPLIIWTIFSFMINMSSEYNQAIEWIKNPVNSTILILLLAVVFYHSGMGLQVVIEDYISNIKLRNTMIVFCKMTLFLLATISIISVLKILFY